MRPVGSNTMVRMSHLASCVVVTLVTAQGWSAEEASLWGSALVAELPLAVLIVARGLQEPVTRGESAAWLCARAVIFGIVSCLVGVLIYLFSTSDLTMTIRAVCLWGIQVLLPHAACVGIITFRHMYVLQGTRRRDGKQVV